MRARVWKMIMVSTLLTLPSMAQDIPPRPSSVIAQPTDPLADHNAAGVYRKASDVVMPHVTYQMEPEFSEKARKKKISGNCLIALTVDAQGMPQNVHVIRSIAETNSTKDRKAALSLDEKAMEAVRQYRFSPGTRHGQAIPVEINIEINFQLY